MEPRSAPRALKQSPPLTICAAPRQRLDLAPICALPGAIRGISALAHYALKAPLLGYAQQHPSKVSDQEPAGPWRVTFRFTSAPPSHQPQVLGFDPREHPRDQLLVQAIGACKDRGEQGPVVGQDRVIAVLEQGPPVDLDLLPRHTSTSDCAAEYPVDAAVPMVGATIAILPEGATELRDHYDHSIIPGRRAEFLGKTCERVPELTDPAREV